MPKKNKEYMQQYDFAALRTRLGGPHTPLTMQQVALTLGISLATWRRAELAGQGQLLLIWACHGIELAVQRQRAGKGAISDLAEGA